MVKWGVKNFLEGVLMKSLALLPIYDAKGGDGGIALKLKVTPDGGNNFFLNGFFLHRPAYSPMYDKNVLSAYNMFRHIIDDI